MMNLENLQSLMAMQAQQQPPKPLVEFRAGILHLSGHTVTADKRRGKVVLIQSPEDGLLHLQWVQRPSGTCEPQDDMTLMQKSATWEKVPECKTGRVFLLRFKGVGARKRFFWMQEPKDDKDADYLKQINDLIDNPPPPEAMGGAGGPGGAGGDMAGLLGMGGGGGGGGGDDMDMDQNQLLNMLAGAGMGPGAAQQNAALLAKQQQQQRSGNSGAKSSGGMGGDADLAAALANAMGANMQESQSGRQSLVDIMEFSNVESFLDEETIQQVLQHLPDHHKTAGELRLTLRAPPFRQTLGRLTGVLNSSQFHQLMASLSVPVARTGNIGVRGLVEALEEQANARNKKAADSSKDTKKTVTLVAASPADLKKTGTDDKSKTSSTPAPAPAPAAGKKEDNKTSGGSGNSNIDGSGGSSGGSGNPPS